MCGQNSGLMTREMLATQGTFGGGPEPQVHDIGSLGIVDMRGMTRRLSFPKLDVAACSDFGDGKMVSDLRRSTIFPT
jgi:hypothetical protein